MVKYFYSYKEFLKFIEKMQFGKGEAVVTGGIDDNLKEYIRVVY
jgi:hypothetical protein